MGQLTWLFARNFSKLCEALAAGHPTLTGVELTDQWVVMCYDVPSTTSTTTHQVRLADWWDGHRRSSCTCPYGQDKDFAMDGCSPIPCKHAIAAWFLSLPAPVRAAALQTYALLGQAWATGAAHDLARHQIPINTAHAADQAGILAALVAAGLEDLGTGTGGSGAATADGQHDVDLEMEGAPL